MDRLLVSLLLRVVRSWPWPIPYQYKFYKSDNGKSQNCIQYFWKCLAKQPILTNYIYTRLKRSFDSGQKFTKLCKKFVFELEIYL